MRGRRGTWARRALLLAQLAGLTPGSLIGCSPRTESCSVCERSVCTGVRFRVEFRDGKRGSYCCPRCASHEVARAGGLAAVVRLEAHDFDTGAGVDPRAASYVEGSDFEHCSARGVLRSAEGGAALRMADRCLPSLIAFRDRAGAEDFVARHGGTIRSFADLRFGEIRSEARPGPGARP